MAALCSSRSRKIQIPQDVERLVEDLLRESVARGDFRNLSGAGKPLNKFEYNPYADTMTHNLNRILRDNGYQPTWDGPQRHIRDRLLAERVELGDPPEPQTSQPMGASVEEESVKINKRVDDYNLVGPMLHMQTLHFSLSREVERAEKRSPPTRTGAAGRERNGEGEEERGEETRPGVLDEEFTQIETLNLSE